MDFSYFGSIGVKSGFELGDRGYGGGVSVYLDRGVEGGD